MSATSVSGVRTYAAVYTTQSIGGWSARSFMTESELQSNASSNEAAGRRLTYLNSYVHSGALRYTAIWASSAPSHVNDFVGLSAADYTGLWNWHNSESWLTGALTGSYVNGSTRYGAYFHP